MTLTITSERRRTGPEALALEEWLYVPASGRDPGLVLDRLAAYGVAASTTASLSDAIERLSHDDITLCLVDLADDRAAASIQAIRARRPDVRIAGIMDPARPIVAAEAVDAGAHDVLPWPLQREDLAALAANVRDDRTAAGVGHLDSSDPPVLFMNSPAMRLVADEMRAAAQGRGGVLVCGERGSGRGRIARAIHRDSARGDGPFVEVDCASLAPDDLECRLFGSNSDKGGAPARLRSPERLAETSAFAEAQGGSLLLMHVADASSRVQTRIARLLRDREMTVGDRRDVRAVDVRPIAGAETAIERDVAEGRLRRDLFDRLAQHRVEVPSLRRRREDIPLLAAGLLQKATHDAGRPAGRFSRSALALLAALPWPGNEPELEALIVRLARTSDGVIQLEDVLAHVHLDGLGPRVDPMGTLREARARFERDWISAVLVRHHGRVGEAARALGIQRTNLYRKVRQLKVARTLLAPRTPPAGDPTVYRNRH